MDSILWHFLAVRWVSLQLLIVVFPGHTHFLKSDQILSNNLYCINKLTTNMFNIN